MFKHDSQDDSLKATISSLSDAQLCAALKSGRTQALVDELYRRHGAFIVKIARAFNSKILFDRGLSYESMMADAVSEAWDAVDKAIARYDGTSSSLRTYLAIAIRSRFMDLQRSNAKRGAREVGLGRLANEDKDGVSPLDYLGADESRDRFADDQFDGECKDMVRVVFSAVTGKKKRCLEVLYRAMLDGVSSPVEYAANELGCSRQAVYVLLKGIHKELPFDFRGDIAA